MVEGVPSTAPCCGAVSRAHYRQQSYTETPPRHTEGAASPYGKLYVEHNHDSKRRQC